jgi:hypothetical protein
MNNPLPIAPHSPLSMVHELAAMPSVLLAMIMRLSYLSLRIARVRNGEIKVMATSPTSICRTFAMMLG